MKRYTYSQARQHLAELLDIARTEEVLITRRDGETFAVSRKNCQDSPFDIPAIPSKAKTTDILAAVRSSRRG